MFPDVSCSKNLQFPWFHRSLSPQPILGHSAVGSIRPNDHVHLQGLLLTLAGVAVLTWPVVSMTMGWSSWWWWFLMVFGCFWMFPYTFFLWVKNQRGWNHQIHQPVTLVVIVGQDIGLVLILRQGHAHEEPVDQGGPILLGTLAQEVI